MGRRALAIVAALLMLASGWVGLAVWRALAAAGSSLSQLETVMEIVSLTKTNYVDPVSATDLLRKYVQTGTIDGMLSVLGDPYTRYLDPPSWQELQIHTSANFAGVGMYLAQKENQLIVQAPIPGSPAQAAGVQPGDVIVKIGDRSTAGMSQDEAVGLIRGPAGTTVRLELQRAGVARPIVVELRRQVVHVPTVTGVTMLPGGVGYLRLTEFSEPSPGQLDQALNRLRAQGMQALLLDLRSNPGGLLETSVAVASRFLDSGPIVYVVSRNAQTQVYSAIPRIPTAVYDLPMVVLVNGGTASAAEIVSGALQDAGRAKLVGTRTFGKGLVQTLIPLRSGGALSLTTSRYLTRAKRTIHHTGIVPDVVVPDPPVDKLADYLFRDRAQLDDPQLRAGYELLLRELAAGPSGATGASGAVQPEQKAA